LDAFLRPSDLGKGWIDGLVVSAGDPALAGEFIELLRFLKANDLQTQVDTDGRHADLLGRILADGLADRVVMDVRGPASRYDNVGETEESMALAAKAPEYAFQTTLQAPGELGHLTVDEARETAGWIRNATGGDAHPYHLARQDQSLAQRKLILYLGAVKAVLPNAELQL
jgi:pyruvate-formate lyase-activating enzyme